MNSSAKTSSKAKPSAFARFFRKHMDLVFMIMRNTIPIFRMKKDGRAMVFVTRFKDVQEVLSRPMVFTVTYGPKTDRAVGPYMLGRDGTTVNQRDKGIMRAFMQREDLPRVAEATARLVDEAVERNREAGEIEVVSEVSRWVPARVLDIYFGFPGPDLESLMRWSRATQHDIFFNLGNDPDTEKKIIDANIQAGQEMREYASQLIARRREELKENPGRDDVLSRLLKAKFPDEIGFDDERIIANILGLLVGGIQTPNTAIVHTLDEILKRPAVQKEASEAAFADDRHKLFRICWEALRFRPVNAFVVRNVLQDYVLASGTFRSKRIRRGSVVLASARSAMRDRRELKAPNEFVTDRPMHNYFHMGYGMHTCLGDQVAREEIIEIIKRLLKLPDLRRASEVNYYFGDDPSDASPFPESYRIRFSASH